MAARGRQVSILRRVSWLLAILAAFALGRLTAGGGTAPPVPGEDPAAAPAGGAEQMYTCSMHPQVRTPNPRDKCPICAMDLIPVPTDGEADDEGERPRLRLTRQAAALMQIRVHPVERRELEVPVRASGRLEADETRLRTIAAWAPGRLERLHVDYTGVAVREGQAMVDLYSPQLIAAQEEYLLALAADGEAADADGHGVAQEMARRTLAAARDRLLLLGLDETQLARLERQGRADDHLTITAPAGGVVVERLAAAGDYVQTGQPIFRLADLSRLWAQVEVYEADLPWLARGQTVVLTADGLPGEPFTGTVAFVEPVLNDRTRTVRVRVEVPNDDGRLRPGMLVRAVIAADLVGGPVLAIPATAPLLTGVRSVVYVQSSTEERPTFEPRDVRLGPRAGDWYVVRDGLEEGDLVVVNGAFKIDSELQIRGRPSMMQPAEEAPPAHDHEAADGAVPSLAGVPDTFRRRLGEIVEANFALVRALAADDPAAAGEAAERSLAALERVAAEQLADPEARGRWRELAARQQAGLAAVAAATDLAPQRQHFETFSDALTAAVQTFGLATGSAVYRAMCPMVQGRRGYWLQAERTIANPYWGAGMLRCGEIVGVLAEPDDPEGERP